MKFFIIVGILLVGAHAISEDFLKQTRQRIRKLAEECVVEEKAQMSDLDTMMNMGVPQSKEGKCMLFCTHKRFNIQNDDGSLNPQGALETFSVLKDEDVDFYNKVVAAFNSCMQTPSKPDSCEFAADLAVCFIQKCKEAGIHELMIE